MESRYAGKVWAVYKNELEPFSKWGTNGTVVCMFDSMRGAENYIDSRKRRDFIRGETGNYSVIPWLVSRG